MCIDNDAARAMIVKELQQNNVPLIDVGMGVQTVDNFLIGSLRVTLVTPEKRITLPDEYQWVIMKIMSMLLIFRLQI